MKKFTLVFIYFLLVSFAFAQGTQRLVLWEEFTSGSCGPCAGVNPQITSYWNSNPDKVVGIQFHMSWPAATDPMYLNNTEDNNARRGVYGVNSIPWASIDGDRYSSTVGSVSSLINIVENAYSTDPSDFDVQISYDLNDAQDQVLITVMITAVEPVTGMNARLHLPVVENYIHLPSPQPNGEQDFYNVMKALVPSSSGTSLPQDWEQNDYEIYQFTWDVFGFYNLDELGVIGFIQNSGASLRVEQAAVGSEEQITPNYAVDMAAIDIETPQVLCNNVVTPKVTIRNQGSDPITSASIHYSVNDGEMQTYEWTGNLNFLESEVIELNEISFDNEAIYDITVSIDNPNNTDDEYAKNNTKTITISESAFMPQNCKVAILTDNHPEETTWDIKNSAGEIIAQGGPYTMTSIYVESFTWPANDCYTFSIYDAGGNGLDGGFYRIVNATNQLIWEGNKDFGFETSAEFAYDEVMGVNDSELQEGFSVFPNPIVSSAQIEFTLLQQSTIQLGIYNLLGKRVIQIYEGIMPLGPQQIQFNTNELESGIYFVKLEVDGQESVQKIQITD